MSASIYWQPEGKGTYLDVGRAKSSFLDMLEKLFGHRGPFEFDEQHAQRLDIAAALTDNHDHSAALLELVAGINTHGSIRVWAEY